MRMTVIPSEIGALGTVSLLWKETGGTGNQRKDKDYPDYNSVKIC